MRWREFCSIIGSTTFRSLGSNWGPNSPQYILTAGANDFGGTLMNESISRAAGAPYGQEITPTEMCRMIRELGRIPARRNTLYEILEIYDDHDPVDTPPLVARTPALRWSSLS